MTESTNRLDRIESILEGHAMAMAELRARQESLQQRQETFQTQLESIAALVSDTRQAALYLVQTAEHHENRIAQLEQE